MNRRYANRILNILFVAFLFTNIASSRPTRPAESKRNISYDSLLKYVGTYPCQKKKNDFFKNKLVVNELRKILKQDYKGYLEFLKLAGCGSIEFTDGLVISDNSQLHVGGYNSIIFFDIANRKTYLLWLKSRVDDKNIRIYGDRPIPPLVQKHIEQNLNQGWGHVAIFKVVKDSVFIQLNNE